MVYISPENKPRQLVFNVTGDQGQGWKPYTAPIGGNTNFEVSLVAVTGESYRGDIAVDELEFKDCELAGKL